MGRHKTISDEEILRVAREVFRARGHTATTREIAESAHISEAILYQRFGSKDDLFFAAMHASGPDIEQLLGPKEPVGDAHAYLRETVVRVGRYFAEVIPMALRVMTHPSFDPAVLARVAPGGPATLQEGLAKRLEALVHLGRIEARFPTETARVLISLAHDWALGIAVRRDSASSRIGELEAMIDVVWAGLSPNTNRNQA